MDRKFIKYYFLQDLKFYIPGFFFTSLIPILIQWKPESFPVTLLFIGYIAASIYIDDRRNILIHSRRIIHSIPLSDKQIAHSLWILYVCLPSLFPGAGILFWYYVLRYYNIITISVIQTVVYPFFILFFIFSLCFSKFCNIRNNSSLQKISILISWVFFFLFMLYFIFPEIYHNNASKIALNILGAIIIGGVYYLVKTSPESFTGFTIKKKEKLKIPKITELFSVNPFSAMIFIGSIISIIFLTLLVLLHLASPEHLNKVRLYEYSFIGAIFFPFFTCSRLPHPHTTANLPLTIKKISALYVFVPVLSSLPIFFVTEFMLLTNLVEREIHPLCLLTIFLNIAGIFILSYSEFLEDNRRGKDIHISVKMILFILLFFPYLCLWTIIGFREFGITASLILISSFILIAWGYFRILQNFKHSDKVWREKSNHAYPISGRAS